MKCACVWCFCMPEARSPENFFTRIFRVGNLLHISYGNYSNYNHFLIYSPMHLYSSVSGIKHFAMDIQSISDEHKLHRIFCTRLYGSCIEIYGTPFGEFGLVSHLWKKRIISRGCGQCISPFRRSFLTAPVINECAAKAMNHLKFRKHGLTDIPEYARFEKVHLSSPLTPFRTHYNECSHMRL